MQGTFGGEVRQTGPRRIEADYPHWPITILMGFPVLTFSAGAVFSVIGVVTTGQPLILVSAAIGAIAAGFMGRRMQHRLRSMGSFVLDLDRSVLVRRRGAREIDRHAASDITRIHRVWDPFHRSFERNYWLVVDTGDGRRYRLGKGPEPEADHCLALLRSWGLPA